MYNRGTRPTILTVMILQKVIPSNKLIIRPGLVNYRWSCSDSNITPGLFRKELGHDMNNRRSLTYRKHWNTLLKSYGNTCYYCNDESPTVIDHIIPVSYGGSDDFLNLVPSCAHCNLIASDKVFDSLEDKRVFVVRERKKKNRRRRCLCVECCLPYEYRFHSPSLLLCAECYDIEYDTNYSERKKWIDWLDLLRTTGHVVKAYRIVGEEHRSHPMNERDRYRMLWNAIEDVLNNERVSIS